MVSGGGVSATEVAKFRLSHEKISETIGSVDFGYVKAGESSDMLIEFSNAEASDTLDNCGIKKLYNADFSILANTCGNWDEPQGHDPYNVDLFPWGSRSCGVSVRYAPSTIATGSSDTLSLYCDDSTYNGNTRPTFIVDLNGTGDAKAGEVVKNHKLSENLLSYSEVPREDFIYPIYEEFAYKFSSKSGALIDVVSFHINAPHSGTEGIENLKNYSLKIYHDNNGVKGEEINASYYGHLGENLLTFDGFSGEVDTFGGSYANFKGNVVLPSAGSYWFSFISNGKPIDPTGIEFRPYLSMAKKSASNSDANWSWESMRFHNTQMGTTIPLGRIYGHPFDPLSNIPIHKTNSDYEDDLSFEYYDRFQESSGKFHLGWGSVTYTMTLSDEQLVMLSLSSSVVNSFLYIYDNNSNMIASNGNSNGAYIEQALPKGTYKVIAATHNENEEGEFRIATNGPTLVPHSEAYLPTFKQVSGLLENDIADGYILATVKDVLTYFAEAESAVQGIWDKVQLDSDHWNGGVVVLGGEAYSYNFERDSTPQEEYLYVKYPNRVDEKLFVIIPGDANYQGTIIPGYELADKADAFMHSYPLQRILGDFTSVRLKDNWILDDMAGDVRFVQDTKRQTKSVFIKSK